MRDRLDKATVEAIKTGLKEGLSRKEIMNAFNINRYTMSRIANGTSYNEHKQPIKTTLPGVTQSEFRQFASYCKQRFDTLERVLKQVTDHMDR